MSSLTHNLIMRHDSWHARWYRYWLSLGGSPAAYKENFCRYVRVLLIWAPLRWFFKGRIKRVVPPWTVGLSASILAFIGVAFYLWPNVALKVLERFGIIVGVIVGILAILVVGALIYDHDPRTAKKVVKWATLPIWIVPYLILLAGIWVWDSFETQLRTFWKFVERRICFGIHPFFVFEGVLVLAALGLLFYKDPVKTGIILGSIIGVIVLIILGVFIVEEIKERRREKRYVEKPKTRLGRAYEGTADTVKLAYTYVDAKKKGSRICPFIDFDNPTTA